MIEKQEINSAGPKIEMSKKVAIIAWMMAATCYFYQYVMRSAPSVMMPELSTAFGLSSLAVASVIGLFYYGYSVFSLVAGSTLDRFGPKVLVPLAVGLMGLGAVLFATGNADVAGVGRFLQGVGAAFAAVGAMYAAANYFPPAQAATFIGATQMFGMAGGSAGQFAVGPMISGGLTWSYFWIGLGAAALLLAIPLFFLLPWRDSSRQQKNWIKTSLQGFKIVLLNPQSLLCGAISGLLFIPTTIFDMIWGVRYLQEAHGLEFGSAVMRSAAIPLGWIIGCPLLGYLSDKIGRRKPVILGGAVVLLGCLAWILYGPTDVLPPYSLALVAGIASGSAILPYTVIKEANPTRLSGTATGVVNFLNFTFSALLGPVFGGLLASFSGGSAKMELSHYQAAFTPLLYGVIIAVILTLLLKETGSRAATITTENLKEATV